MHVTLTSANEKYMLAASYLFCILLCLLIDILVMLCNVGYSTANCCVIKQVHKSREALCLWELKQFHNICVEGTHLQSKNNHILSMQSHDLLAWYECRIMTAGKPFVVPDFVPGCVRLTDLMFVWYSEGVSYCHPCGFILLDVWGYSAWHGYCAPHHAVEQSGNIPPRFWKEPCLHAVCQYVQSVLWNGKWEKGRKELRLVPLGL